MFLLQVESDGFLDSNFTFPLQQDKKLEEVRKNKETKEPEDASDD